MTPDELTAARKALGMKAADLGRALELEGRDPGRLIGLWESGKHRIPGPAAVAVRLMLEAKARQTVQDAMQQAQALLQPEPAQWAPQGFQDEPAPAPVTTRRRG
jgi:hypothetical protein